MLPSRLPHQAPHQAISGSADFDARKREFGRRIAASENAMPGGSDVSRYQWYHTVDCGDDLITPGMYDYRDTIQQFAFPEDMRGMSVLDIGAATGYFSFEFERRGARVVATELPSLHALDRFPGQTVEQSVARIERMIFPDYEPGPLRHTEEELWGYLLDLPFRFCHERLGSKVERRFLTAYEISPETLGATFDLVFIGEVLLHTLYPLKALAAAASVCRGTLVVTQKMPETNDETPAMTYVGGADPDDDHVSWWLPNKACMVELLHKLRFPTVVEAGRHSCVLQPYGYAFERVVLHASR